MDNEELKKGEELSKKIDGHKEHLDRLNDILNSEEDIRETSIKIRWWEENQQETCFINKEYIIVALILEKEQTKKELKAIEEKFKSL